MSSYKKKENKGAMPSNQLPIFEIISLFSELMCMKRIKSYLLSRSYLKI